MNLGMFAPPVVLLVGCIHNVCVCVRVCVCVCVCGRAALTRSPKNTSLVVKRVRSHHASRLIHTNLASILPVVESTRLGRTKLRQQLPGSHDIGQGRSKPNLITLFRACRHMCHIIYTIIDTHAREINQ